MGKLDVDGTEIQVLLTEEDDYISLTDMVRKIDNGPALIEKWLRSKNTTDFLGIWEEMNNADFRHSPFYDREFVTYKILSEKKFDKILAEKGW